MKNEDNPLQQYNNMLVDDVKSIYGFQHYLITVRGLILGASLTLMGAIITFTRTNSDRVGFEAGFATGSIHLLLLGIAYTTVMIMGSMNRAQWVFGAYIDS